MDVKKLDSVSREEQKAILSNAISRCMIENHMTLENLDEACESVRKSTEKMPRLKADDIASPSLSPVAFTTTEIATIKFLSRVSESSGNDSRFAIAIVSNECTIG